MQKFVISKSLLKNCKFDSNKEKGSFLMVTKNQLRAFNDIFNSRPLNCADWMDFCLVFIARVGIHSAYIAFLIFSNHKSSSFTIDIFSTIFFRQFPQCDASKWMKREMLKNLTVLISVFTFYDFLFIERRHFQFLRKNFFNKRTIFEW